VYLLIWIAVGIWGRSPQLPPSQPHGRGLLGLAAGSVIAATACSSARSKRIEAAPASVLTDH